jgi:hypothetical protein
LNGGIAINVPDTTLREQGDELLKAYRKEMKVFALKKRLAHAAVEPAMPTLVKLGIGTAAPALLDYLHEHCGFMLVCEFSEFGAYFRTANGSLDGKSYMVDMFMAERIRVFEVETIRELPVW